MYKNWSDLVLKVMNLNEQYSGHTEESKKFLENPSIEDLDQDMDTLWGGVTL